MHSIDFSTSNIRIKNHLKQLHESDIAVLFESQRMKNRIKIYEAMGVKQFANVFILIDEQIAKKFYLELSIQQKKSLLRALEIDDLKTFIETFRVSEYHEIYELLPQSTQTLVKKIQAYDGDTAGSVSSPHFIILNENLSVKDVTDYVVKQSEEKDEVDVIFFKNQNTQKFAGALKLSELITARANTKLEDILDEHFPFVYHDDLITKSLKKIRDYDIMMLPVLDDNDYMIGVITSDDALSIMEQSHIENIESLVSLHDHSDEQSAIRRSANRLPWLLLAVVLNLVIASFLAVFQGTLEAHVALVPFLPMILGMSGNIGTQSNAVTILGLHHERISPVKHLVKEMGIALINSLIASVVGVGIVYLFLTIFPQSGEQTFMYALIVGLSLIISMFISAFAGVMLPFILRRLGLDEKAASGPLITTINDFTAVGVYLLLATLLLMQV